MIFTLNLLRLQNLDIVYPFAVSPNGGASICFSRPLSFVCHLVNAFSSETETDTDIFLKYMHAWLYFQSVSVTDILFLHLYILSTKLVFNMSILFRYICF